MSQVARRRGFTLIELAIAACLLVIVLGLAVSLSRHVRAQSARVLTSDILARMERLLDAYLLDHPIEGLDQVTPLVFDGELREVTEGNADGRGTNRAGAAGVALEEPLLLRRAIRNNREWLSRLTAATPPAVAMSPEVLGQLSLSVYDPRYPSLRDAWGTPIVFVRRRHPDLGMAPRDAPFFLSAGPDRRFLTVDDNLYSYEAFPRPN